MNSSLAAQLEETFAGLPVPAIDTRPAKRSRKDKTTATVIPITTALPVPQATAKPTPEVIPHTSTEKPVAATPVKKASRLKNWEAMPVKESLIWRGTDVMLSIRGGTPVERNNEPCIEHQLDASLRLRVFGHFDGLSLSERVSMVGDMTIVARRRPNGRVFLIVDFRIHAEARAAQYKAFIRPASAEMKHLGTRRSRYFTSKNGGAVFIAKHTD